MYYMTLILQAILFLASININTSVSTKIELNSKHNLTEFLQHRKKRTLIYQNNGSIKFSIGPSMPVPLGDAVSFRSLVCSYNLQGGQYPLPQNPIYPWDKWEGLYARSLKQRMRIIQESQTDDSRQFVYTALENYFNRQQEQPRPQTKQTTANIGRQCLLRSICENAQIHTHEGIFSEVLNVILTPGKALSGLEIYNDAYEAGKSGANCLLVYKECPLGKNIFDQYFLEN